MAKGNRKSKAKAIAKSLTPNQKAEVKKLVKGVAETKMAAWYGGANIDISGAQGLFSQAQAYGMTQVIDSNQTDLLRVIPIVAQGLNDNNRVGQRITPVSLKIHCNVSILVNNQNLGLAQNLFAVAYLLQHVSLKSYQALREGNNFSQLLDVGDGTTVNFNGKWSNLSQPVSKQYYKLLGKKVIALRSSGFYTGVGGTSMNNNSHQFTHNFTWDATKHLPKTLMYPENQSGPNTWLNDPTNSSLFWCVAYYNMDDSNPPDPTVGIQQRYSAFLRFKDI